MRIFDIFRLSLSHVKKSRMRTWLTIIDIVIGVAAIVAIISIGQGMQETVQARLKSLGADMITVSPGYSRAERGGFGGGAMNAVVTPELLVFALAFSVFVGVISGVVPARTAAKMNPVEALRFEQ